MAQSLHFLNGRVTIDPDICNGQPTIRSKRITVQSVLEYLGAGDSEADIIAEFPELEPEDIRACLNFAGQIMSQRYDVLKVA